MKSVRVVIPIYRSELSDFELKLLRHNLEQLRRYNILLVAPIFLDISKIVLFISSMHINIDLDVIRVSNRWLGVKNGLNGYNKMMLSKSFYELFSDYEYILICQTDACIFKGDNLQRWCSMGFDYIGAPWLKKRKYDNEIIRLFYRLKALFSSRKSLYKREDILGRVGNGGLSIRRVASHIKAINKYENEVDFFIENSGHNLNNEDIFWAMVPTEFSRPKYEDAFRFSIDLNPEESMKMLPKGEFPFGCHGLNDKKIYVYWQELLSKLL